jgi:hypothetical protein
LIEYRERWRGSSAKIKARSIRWSARWLSGGFSSIHDIASGDQSEETFDPSRSVMLNSGDPKKGQRAASRERRQGRHQFTSPQLAPGSAGGNPLFRRSESTAFQTSPSSATPGFRMGK